MQNQKYIYLFTLITVWHSALAQQIKRQTLTSRGSVTNHAPTAPLRVSYTAGSCPGCNTLHPQGNNPYLRQGFQQPPNTDENGNPVGCTLSVNFDFQENNSANCGKSYDFQYTGGTAGASYSWDFGDQATPRYATTANPMQIVYVTTGYKNVTLTIRKDSCTKSIAHLIYVDTSRLGFGVQSQITNITCLNSRTGAIRLDARGGTGTKKFRWSTGDTIQNLTGLTAGRYQCTITDANNCRFVLDTLIRQEGKKLEVNPVITNATCRDYRDGSILLLLAGGQTPYRITWQTGDSGLRLDSLRGGQSYQVSVRDSLGCQLDTLFKVGFKCDTNSRRIGEGIFDVITPNGDGKNDTWTFKDITSYPNNVVFIYNRWGQLVYYKKNYANQWAGTNDDGEILSVGAYYYVVRLNDENNTVYTGSVTLIR